MTSGVFFINMHSCASNINRPICASCSMQSKLNSGGCNIYMVMCTADLPHNADLLPPPVMQTSRLPRSVCSSQFQQLDDALRLSPPHPHPTRNLKYLDSNPALFLSNASWGFVCEVSSALERSGLEGKYIWAGRHDPQSQLNNSIKNVFDNISTKKLRQNTVIARIYKWKCESLAKKWRHK